MFQYFDNALMYVLHNEGGLINDAKDPGGITNWGICLRTLRGHGLKYDWDKNGIVNELEIEHLTGAQCEEYYKNEYWNPRYDEFTSQTVAIYVFDMAVSMGPGTAHKLLQRAVNSYLGTKNMVTVDGVIGDKTLTYINSAGINLMPALRAQREGEYRLIVKENPNLADDLDGFINRTFKL